MPENTHNIGMTHDRRKLVLLALMCTMMLAAMDITIVSTAIPQIVSDLNGFSLISWVFSAYILAQTVSIPIYGKLSDLYGRKPILLFGIIIFVLSSAASAAAWNMTALIVFRGLQGLGAGSIMATVNTLAGDLYSIKERSRIQGWLSSVWGMAAILAPTLGGVFAEYVTWRWIFIINLPIGIIALALIKIFLREKSTGHQHHIDIPGAILILITGTTLVFTLLNGGHKWEWLSLQGIGMILLTVILIGITIFIERKSIEPIMPTQVWSNKILLGANVAMIAMGAIMIGPNMYLPVYAQSVLGLGAIAAGFVLASMSITWPLASSISGRLYTRIGFRNTALIGAVLVIIGSVTFVILPYKSPIWTVVMVQMILGAGFGFLSTPTLVGIQSIVPWKQRGVVTSTNMFSRYLGQSIGSALMGGIYNFSISEDLVKAPDYLKGDLPVRVNKVIDALHSTRTGGSVKEYLKHSFDNATHSIYFIMAIIGVISLLSLLILPRYFPIVHQGGVSSDVDEIETL